MCSAKSVLERECMSFFLQMARQLELACMLPVCQTRLSPVLAPLRRRLQQEQSVRWSRLPSTRMPMVSAHMTRRDAGHGSAKDKRRKQTLAAGAAVVRGV